MKFKLAAPGGAIWRQDWFLGLCIVALALALNQWTDVFGSLERRFYDFASTSSARQPSDRVAVIAIDDQSIANIGRWPWPRDVHAQLIDQLAAQRAGYPWIGFEITETNHAEGLAWMQEEERGAVPPIEGQGRLW